MYDVDYRNSKFWVLIPENLKICSRCGEKLNPDDVEVHHKNGKKYDDSPENLALICSQCHRGIKRYTIETTIPITVKFPQSLLKKIDEESTKLEINKSVFIRNVIWGHFTQLENKTISQT